MNDEQKEWKPLSMEEYEKQVSGNKKAGNEEKKDDFGFKMPTMKELEEQMVGKPKEDKKEEKKETEELVKETKEQKLEQLKAQAKAKRQELDDIYKEIENTI